MNWLMFRRKLPQSFVQVSGMNPYTAGAWNATKSFLWMHQRIPNDLFLCMNCHRSNALCWWKNTKNYATPLMLCRMLRDAVLKHIICWDSRYRISPQKKPLPAVRYRRLSSAAWKPCENISNFPVQGIRICRVSDLISRGSFSPRRKAVDDIYDCIK